MFDDNAPSRLADSGLFGVVLGGQPYEKTHTLLVQWAIFPSIGSFHSFPVQVYTSLVFSNNASSTLAVSMLFVIVLGSQPCENLRC